MARPKMLLGVQLADNYGVHPAAWRMPDVDPSSHINIDQMAHYAQEAERGGLHFIFLPDRPLLDADLAQGPPRFQLEPLLTLTVMARATQRIGLVASASTTFNEAYNLARQLKTLDIISHGRAGWNAIATNDPLAAANYGQEMPPRHEKHVRLNEVLQVVQALWGSWEYEAGQPDQAGKFADPRKVQPINLQGQYVGSRGPLPIPPSEQGQPIIFQAGGGEYGLQSSARYADVVIGMPVTPESGKAYRNVLREAATQAGRAPDELKAAMFVSFGLGNTKREALDRRRALDARADQGQQLAQLGHMLSLRLNPQQADEPLTPQQLDAARIRPGDAKAAQALALAQEGWSPLDIVAHGVLDVSPGVVGTPAEAADFLQDWFEQGAADAFILAIDSLHDGLTAFVDGVIPILRERGLVDTQYAGATLRENLGVPAQYGRDPRFI